MTEGKTSKLTSTFSSSSIDAGEARLLFLNDDVDANSIKPIMEEILKINYQDEEKDKKEKDYERKPIRLVVNTYGGSVYEGFALISVIEQSKTPVHTYVYGKAMSMGFLIASSGHKRYASKLSSFMYHQISSWPWGKIEQLKEDIAECERLQKMYDTYLLSKTNIREADLQPVKDRRGEWYFGWEEALKLKLIDEAI